MYKLSKMILGEETEEEKELQDEKEEPGEENEEKEEEKDEDKNEKKAFWGRRDDPYVSERIDNFLKSLSKGYDGDMTVADNIASAFPGAPRDSVLENSNLQEAGLGAGLGAGAGAAIGSLINRKNRGAGAGIGAGLGGMAGGALAYYLNKIR